MNIQGRTDDLFESSKYVSVSDWGALSSQSEATISQIVLKNQRAIDTTIVSNDQNKDLIREAQEWASKAEEQEGLKKYELILMTLSETVRKALQSSLYAHRRQNSKKNDNYLTFTLTEGTDIGHCNITFELINSGSTPVALYDSMRVTDNFMKKSDIIGLTSVYGNKYSFWPKSSFIRGILAVEIESRLHML